MARHPAGLAGLLTTEMLERLSFFGMQTLLALYLAAQLATPAAMAAVWGLPALAASLHLDGPVLAASLLGVNAALLQAAPLVGAVVTDRRLGRDNALRVGAGSLLLGHFLLAAPAMLLPGLAALVIGSGLFKSALAARVDSLYSADDPGRDDGFRLLDIAINIGGLLAPLLIGTVGERLGWHWGFALAGLVMLVAAAAGQRAFGLLPAERPIAPPPPQLWQGLARPLLLAIPAALAVTANFQLLNAYLPWASRHADLKLGATQMPVTWLIAGDALIGLAALAGTNWFWQRWRVRRALPAVEGQMAAGALITSLAALWLATAAALFGDHVPLAGLLLFHLLNDIGAAQILPLLAAEAARRAPAGFTATAITGANAVLLLGAVSAATLASLLPRIGGPLFWAAHAGVALAAALLFWLMRRSR
ncbi:POT-type proton-dependent oligopeptide transporter [Sandarakinorhabdus oryzae]|uniref:POT-type proton-dependent oligopeptide transporter n=1 Tax=Sandarakinorhabdus oryzae TaxID=2675220 RepID=UPI0012E1AF62|nr:MFS transporter [Sandarakinorhabdus oryzae]